jgi:hypothetical protein
MIFTAGKAWQIAFLVENNSNTVEAEQKTKAVTDVLAHLATDHVTGKQQLGGSEQM